MGAWRGPAPVSGPPWLLRSSLHPQPGFSPAYRLAQVILQQVHEDARVRAGREGMGQALHGRADRVGPARLRGGSEGEGRRGHFHDATGQ